MSKFLTIDIGAGTIDLLYYDDEAGIHYKTVARSPVLYLAEKVASLQGNLLITGCEMGGGAISQVLKGRARYSEVIMSRSSAYTIHHDLEKVRSSGITVMEDEEAEALKAEPGYKCLTLGDLQMDWLRSVIEALGVPFAFDVVGICAQDHGTPPPGVSHLDYRHNLFEGSLNGTPFPYALLFEKEEVPRTFNRLRSIAQTAASLPCSSIYVMDSGMAAVLGASLDGQATGKKNLVVLDVATSHTVGAALMDGEIAGFFEYHTHDLTLERLETLIQGLTDGNLRHEEILKEGGHGAYTRKAMGFDAIEAIIATGPKRRMIQNSRLPILLGAPMGDNMMTGTVGLLAAIMKRMNLPQVGYF